MADEQVQKLIQGAIRAVKNGERDLARRAFLQALKLDPANEAGWLGLASVGKDRDESLFAIKRLLLLNPHSERARSAAQRLGVDPDSLLDESPASPPVPSQDTAAEALEAPPLPEPPPIPEPPLFGNTPLPEPPIPEPPLFGNAPLPEPPPIPEPPLFGNTPLPEPPPIPEPPLFGNTPLPEPPPLPEPLKKKLTPVRATGEAPAVRATGEMPSVRATGETPAVRATGEMSNLPVPDSAEVQDSERPFISSQEAFARLSLPQGTQGVPVPNRVLLQAAQAAAEQTVQAYIEQELRLSSGQFKPETETPIAWQVKKRRAGENEIVVLRLQIAAAVISMLVILGGGGFWLAIQNPDVAAVVFAPTLTYTPTPTMTPTSTPGVTPTPSATPRLTATPSPTFPPFVATANLYIPPEPTDINVPSGVFVNARIVQIERLLERGAWDAALTAIQQERTATELSGDFLPSYYLVQWYLAQGDLAGAERAIEEGERLWQERAPNANYQSLVDVARAQVLEAELTLSRAQGEDFSAEQREALNLTLDTLRGVEDEDGRLTQEGVLQRDGNYVQGYVMLARLLNLQGERQAALSALEDTQALNADLLADASIRIEKARLYAQEDEIASALQELHDLLRIQPYALDALRLQSELALADGQAGLAVLYAEEYLLRYPGSVEGYRLRGDGYAAEGKDVLAFVQYERALLGSASPSITAQVYAKRAALHQRRGEIEQALADYAQALEIAEDALAIRAQRLDLLIAQGDARTARQDIQALLGTGVWADARLNWRLAQISSPSEALRLLDSALASDALPEPERAQALALQARNYLAQDLSASALSAIDEALTIEERGSWRFIRGQALEALAQASQTPAQRADLLAQAQAEYEQVLTWNSVFAYPFADEVRARLDALQGTS